MINQMDTARLWAYCDEAIRANDALLDMLDATLGDEDSAPMAKRLQDQLKGARLKAKAAKKELGKAEEFVDQAREMTKRGGAR